MTDNELKQKIKALKSAWDDLSSSNRSASHGALRDMYAELQFELQTRYADRETRVGLSTISASEFARDADDDQWAALLRLREKR